MPSLPSSLDAPLHLDGLTIPNRLGLTAATPSGAAAAALDSPGLIVVRPFAGPLGPWLNDEPPREWEESVAGIHATSNALVMAQLVVEGGAGPDPLIFAAQRMAAAGFDLLELVPSPHMMAAAPGMVAALRSSWKNPLVCRFPRGAFEAGYARDAVARGLAMISVDAADADGPAGNGAMIRLRYGISLLAYHRPAPYETLALEITEGYADLAVILVEEAY
ncbi:MAG: hypothetical protein WD533_06310 [Dehalococcoidia bacterium]